MLTPLVSRATAEESEAQEEAAESEAQNPVPRGLTILLLSALSWLVLVVAIFAVGQLMT